MKNIFEFAEACLHSTIIDEKLALTQDTLLPPGLADLPASSSRKI